MGKAFSISFDFHGTICQALVSLKDKGYDLYMQVHYLNEEIEILLPGRKMVLSLIDGLLQPADLSSPYLTDLAKATTEAISKFLVRAENDISSPSFGDLA